MSVTELKSGLHRLVDAVSDERLLTAIYALLDNQATVERDFWHDLSPEQQVDIQHGLEDLDAGRTQPAKAVFARYQ